MKDLEAYQCDTISAKNLTELFTETEFDSKPFIYRNLSSRQWYWFGLAIVALAFAAATALTWRRWGTITGDFGIDLYISWRLSHGAVLYRDLYFFAGGPFSQYFDALLFKIFGVSVSTFVISNLAAVAITLLILFRRFAKAADTWTATAICVAFIVVFAFPLYFFQGCNFLAPYSEEAVQGLVLSILGVVFLTDWLVKQRFYFAILAGFCNGMVFLTKPDIFLALAACDIAAFGLLVFFFRKTGFAVKSFGAFMAASMVPPLFFFFYFLGVENWRDSIHSVAFAWVPVFNSAVIKQPFYQWCTGLDRPCFHIQNILFQSALVVAVTAFYAVAFRIVKHQKVDWTGIQQRAVPAFAPVLMILIYADRWHQTGECFSSSFMVMLAFLWLLLTMGTFLVSTVASHSKAGIYRSPWAIHLLLTVPLFAAAWHADWIDCGYSLPLLALVSCAVIYSNRHSLADRQKFVFPFLWSVFGLVLLSKMGLFPRIWHYGFVLAMPAFAAGIYCLFWLVPPLLEKKWQAPAAHLRGAAAVVLMTGICALFHQSARNYALQDVVTGSGPNKMFASDHVEHANEYNAALGWIESNAPKHATLAVLPEGAMINLLTQRINPTPCLFWDQNVMSVFGQAKMTAAFEKSPPDYVLIVERKWVTDAGYLGSPGYGYDVMQWIKHNYQPQIIFGQEPLKNGHFGIEILKHLPIHSGGLSRSSSERSFGDRKLIPTTNEASVQPKPSWVM